MEKHRSEAGKLAKADSLAKKALLVNFRLPCTLGLQEAMPRVRYVSFMVLEVAWRAKELGIKNITLRGVG